MRLALAGVAERVSAVARAPLDLRGAGVRETVDQAALDELPSARDIWTVLELTPAVLMNKINVGGSESGQQSLMSAAGSAWTQNQYYLNGVNVTDPAAAGASLTYFSFDSFEEVEISTSGHRAEIQTPGVFVNIVPKRGGNRFSGETSFFFEHERLQAQNLDDALRARGVGQANRLKGLYDAGASLGGPIRRDRAWFYGNWSRVRIEPYLPGFFLPGGEPGVDLTQLDSAMGKASVEIADGHEIGVFGFRNAKYRPYRGAGLFRPSPETTFHQDSVSLTGQLSWSGIFGDTALVEARLNWLDLDFPYGRQPDATPDFSRQELNSGRWFGGSGTNTHYDRRRLQAGATATLFEDGLFGATHEFRAGFEVVRNAERITHDLHGGIVYIHDRVRPIEVTLYSDPVAERNHVTNIGGFAQDTLVRGRLALEVGLRADWWRAGYPDQTNPPGRWGDVFAGLGVGRETPGNPAVVSWLGVAPRIGAAFRLTADGRTVARAFVGRYLHQLSLDAPGYQNENARASARYRFEDRNFNGLADEGEIALGAPLAVFLPARNEVAADLRQPRTDEITLGVVRELPGEVTVGLTGILRRETDLLEDTDIGGAGIGVAGDAPRRSRP